MNAPAQDKPLTVDVTLFKASGKYYTTEPWRVPADAIGPYDMSRSPDFRRISDSGAVLIGSQEPWGFPHLFPTLVADEPLRNAIDNLANETAGRVAVHDRAGYFLDATTHATFESRLRTILRDHPVPAPDQAPGQPGPTGNAVLAESITFHRQLAATGTPKGWAHILRRLDGAVRTGAFTDAAPGQLDQAREVIMLLVEAEDASVSVDEIETIVAQVAASTANLSGAHVGWTREVAEAVAARLGASPTT